MSHVANIYPHHDLLNLAFYHLRTIQRKKADNNLEAITLDCMSCLIALAISVEGLINFCGLKLVDNWKERESYQKKLEKITEALEIVLDETNEPFQTLSSLKILRDQLAHPKPINREGEVKNKEELHKLMESTWASYCNLEFVHHAYKQVKLFENLIYKNQKIKKSGILTSATGYGEINA